MYKLTITPAPSYEEVSKALQILENQKLHVYQLLYHNQLTSPYGYPLKVSRLIRDNGYITAVINISVANHVVDKGLVASVYAHTPDDKILEKVKLLMSGVSMEKPFEQACCVFAKRVSCVCDVAFECELHGSTHIGSHD